MGTYFHLLSSEVITLIDLFIPTSRESARRLANAAVTVKLIIREYCSKCGENHQLPETCKQYNNKLKMLKAPVTWRAIGREGCMITWVGYADVVHDSTISGWTEKHRYEVDIFHSDIEKFLGRRFTTLQLQRRLKNDTVERFFHRSIPANMLY